jgi:hypothetical protein
MEVTVTVAPTTVPPLTSVTVPITAPFDVCALAVGIQTDAEKPAIANRLRTKTAERSWENRIGTPPKSI